MPKSARQFDLWSGICCCHYDEDPVCQPMVGFILGNSATVQSVGIKQAMTTHLTIGTCNKHTGIIITGSASSKSDKIAKARIGDLVTGCNIGVIITGSSTHEIG